MKKITIGSKPIARPADHATADQWVNNRLNTEPTKRLTIDVPLTLHKRIKSQCAIRSVNMAEEIRKLLEGHFPEESRQDRAE